MEKLYQIPSESCDEAEQRGFWAKVIADQIASCKGAEKFCQQHQLNFSAFHYWKYSKIRLLTNDTNHISKQKNRQHDKDATKFVQLQVAVDTPSNEYHKNETVGGQAKEIVIIFKNGHKIILPLAPSEANLLLLIKTVGSLQC